MSNLYIDTTQLEAGEGYVQQQILLSLLGPVVDGERSEPNKCDVKLGLVYSLEGTGTYALLKNEATEHESCRVTEYFQLQRTDSSGDDLITELISSVKCKLNETFQSSLRDRSDELFLEKINQDSLLCYRKENTLYFTMAISICEEELQKLNNNYRGTPITVMTPRLITLFNLIKEKPTWFNWDSHLVLFQL